jgi:hypothetical protein
MSYLQTESLKPKTKGTLFSSILHSVTVEIFLFLNYNQNGLDIVIFFAHKQFIYPNLTTFTKWSYLCEMASKQKTKRTFTSQTFEIGEKKVPLVFGLESK